MTTEPPESPENESTAASEDLSAPEGVSAPEGDAAGGETQAEEDVSSAAAEVSSAPVEKVAAVSAEEASKEEEEKAPEEEKLEAGDLAGYPDETLPSQLRKALQKHGFTNLTAVQQAVVAADTNARDLRISSQTGSGKTVAVGIALGRELIRQGARRDQANRSQQEQAEEGEEGEEGKEKAKFDPRAPQVLLLTPTRELAAQVQKELVWLFKDVPDAQVEVVTGGTSVGLERKALSRGPRMIVGTPGRVLDHLTRGAFKGEYVTQVVLDEADQMLDMGFRDELQAILEQLPGRSRTHLVSATFSGEIRRIAERYQTNAAFLEGSALGAANQDIEHLAHVVGHRHRYDALINILLRAHAEKTDDKGGRTLIFTRTRADCLEISERLQQDGLRAEPLSGDLAQAQRTRTLTAFRSGRVSTLVATDVAARGLDVQGIDLVVHLDPPENGDAYTHRSGRTGRAGRKGTTILFMPPQARGRVERMLHMARVKPQWAPVPTADKIRKLYTKLGRKRLYETLENEVEEEKLAYARKLMEEHAAERIIANLLPAIDVKPPCPPRDISETFAQRPQGGGGRHDPRGRGRGRGDPRGRGGPRSDSRHGSGDGGGGGGTKWRGGGDRQSSGYSGGGDRQGGGGRQGGGYSGGGYSGGGDRQGGGYSGGGDRQGGGYSGGGRQGGGYSGGGDRQGGGYSGGGDRQGGGNSGGGDRQGGGYSGGGDRQGGGYSGGGDRQGGGYSGGGDRQGGGNSGGGDRQGGGYSGGGDRQGGRQGGGYSGGGQSGGDRQGGYSGGSGHSSDGDRAGGGGRKFGGPKRRFR